MRDGRNSTEMFLESELGRLAQAEPMKCREMLARRMQAQSVLSNVSLTSIFHSTYEQTASTKGQKPIRIAHVVSPVFEKKGSGMLDQMTLITLRSMAVAKELAETLSNGRIQVELWLCNYADEPRPNLPGMRYTIPLNRSVIELAEKHNIDLPLTKANPVPRRLPVAADILDALAKSTSADHLSFTNADIGVMPYFYIFAATWLRAGLDGMFVNRVPIPLEAGLNFKTLDDILDAGLQYPQNHGGWDCFVFTRKQYQKFQSRLGLVVVGAPPIGTKLRHAVNCYAKHFLPVTKKHVTFHLGGTGSGDKEKHSGWGFGRGWNYNYHKHYPEKGHTPCVQNQPFLGTYDDDKTERDVLPVICKLVQGMKNGQISTPLRLYLLMLQTKAILP